jgi:ADP-L-glycero-D-manno-heptose 6-epimerase
MKKAIITGTKGFIGKNLKKEIENNFDVFEINEDIFDEYNWEMLLHEHLYHNKPDVVFHVGACSDTLEQNVNYMMTRNFESTKIIVDFCKEENVPLIYSSSAASYGDNDSYPSNLYGWSKYVAEKYVISNGMVALRYFNVYGPGEEHKGKMASVAYQMMEKYKKGQKVKLFPLDPKRDFVYIKDVISANLYAFNNYKTIKGSYYDVGFGEPRTFEDVMDILEIKYSYHDYDMIPKGYQFYTCSNSNKWMKGWKPEYNLEKGLTDYIISLNHQANLRST